jgi:UDP-N-acetyl-D-mannosaminuronate dehydrogenase
VELKETISSLKSKAGKKIHLNVLSRIDSLLKYDAIVLAVSHDSFIKYSETLADQRFKSKIIYDLQGFLPKKLATWRL